MAVVVKKEGWWFCSHSNSHSKMVPTPTLSCRDAHSAVIAEFVRRSL